MGWPYGPPCLPYRKFSFAIKGQGSCSFFDVKNADFAFFLGAIVTLSGEAFSSMVKLRAFFILRVKN